MAGSSCATDWRRGGRRAEGGRGKKSHVKDLLPSPCPAPSLLLCPWLSRAALPGCGDALVGDGLGGISGSPSPGQCSLLGQAHGTFQSTPGLFLCILLQGGGAGSDLSKNKYPGGSGERLELPWEGQEQADPGDSAGCFEELMLHEKGTIGAPGAL